MARNITFNLLKPILPPKTAWDKVYDWILGRARIVVLATIILIALAFVAKVIVDTDAKNKDKAIGVLKIQLDFYGSKIEPDLRTFASKTDNYIKLWNGASGVSTAISEVYSYISDPAADVTVKVDADRISIVGTENLTLLKDLESKLRASPTFSSVTFSDLTLQKQDIDTQQGQYVVVATIKNPTRPKI